MDLGVRVTAWRKAKGWTQKQLAEETDLSRASICQIEANEQYPTKKSLDALLTAFGVTAERFFGRLPKAKRNAA